VHKPPAAFMSYAHIDDKHLNGMLSEFCRRLSAEVRVQTGREFVIFQDRTAIAWGQNWQARINEALDTVTLLIPIITPSFFRSESCRKELGRFLDREKRLGRNDLILPVYLIYSDEMEDRSRREVDHMARVLSDRQWADWRELRFEPFTSTKVKEAVAQLAQRMRDPFWQDVERMSPGHGGGPPRVAIREPARRWTPISIRRKRFTAVMGGYAMHEVDVLLDEITLEYIRLQDEKSRRRNDPEIPSGSYVPELTPAAIRGRKLTKAIRGYSVQEVDSFLESIQEDLAFSIIGVNMPWHS
jgi:DivIVA domain-containing protein